MFDPLVQELSERYGLGDRGRDLFALLVAYVHNERRGGFGGFVEGFREQGHSELLASWVGNPDAGGLGAGDVGTVFGQGLLSDWGTRLGVSRATVAAAIAGVLPRLVAELTPGGRMPGGFEDALPPGRGAPRAAAPVQRESVSAAYDDSGDFRVVPGVDGLVSSRQAAQADMAPADLALMDVRPDAAASPGFGPDDFIAAASGADAPPAESAGPIVPGIERRDASGAVPPPTMPASESLRREPAVPPAPAAVRSPADARREQDASTQAMDPGERRIAEMAAALDPGDARAGASPPMRADRRPDGWRQPMQPPPRRIRWGWWLLLLLLLAAAGIAFAWWQGLLAPWLQPLIEQYGLPILAQPPAS